MQPDAQPADQPSRSPILVGRDEELERLKRLLARAAGGTPVTLLVRGEVGAGKTRLLTEFAAIARDSGALVVSGSCIALGSGEIPYAPMVEALRGLVRMLGERRVRDLVGDAYAGLTNLVAGLIDMGSAASAPAGLSDKSRVFGAILQLLDKLGADGPVVLILEDLQWADPSTLDLLAYLARTQSGERLLLIGSYRTTDLEPRHPLRTLVAELELARKVDQLEVPQFGRTGLKLLLRAILHIEPGYDLVERVLEASDGNAFFVEELLTAGMSTADDGAVALPPTVQELVLARFARLDGDAQEVMRVAATAGRSVNHRLLATVCDLSERQLSSALRECMGSQLLVNNRSEDTYRFRHAIMREVVHEDLLPSERTSLHRAIAAALAADSRLSLADQLTVAAELSYHWHEAGAYPEALAAAAQAGNQAMRLFAFREAGRQYERALTVWPLLDGAADIAEIPKARLLISAADAARWAGRIDRAIELAQAAASEVDTARDPELAGELYERLGNYQWEAGDYASSERAYAEAGLLLEVTPPSAAAARVLAVKASKQVRDGHYVEGVAIGRDALAMARSVAARPEQGRALMWIGAGKIMQGDVDAGAADLWEAVAIADAENVLEDLHRAHANLAYALENAGRLDQSLAVALGGLDRIRQTGVEHTRAFSLLANNACATMVQLGRWDEASAIISELLSARPVAESLFPRLTLAEIEVARGNFAVVDRLLAEVGSVGGSVTQPQFIASQYACAAEAAIWQGDHLTGRAAVADGLRLIGDTEHGVAVLRLCALGLRNGADEWLRRTGPIVSTVDELMGVVNRVSNQASGPVLPDVVALLQLCRAERSRIDGADQVSVWADMAATWEGLGRPYPAAYSRWREAEAVGRDPAADARPAIDQAYRTAQLLAAQPLREAVSALAARLGLALETEPADQSDSTDADIPVAGPPGDEYRLTPREREVLALVCTAKSNRQIGTLLSISDKTVSVHLTNLMAKLGVSSRTAAALMAAEQKLVPRPPSH